MEAPTMDWRVEECPSSDDGNGKMGWIWNKGLSLGKKVLVAGFVISSAPIVLPPLVVASTIAVLSSAPYGLFLASYACTEKLMSTLLPSTEPPSSLLHDGGVDETGAIKKDENGYDGYVGDGMQENKYGDDYTNGEGITEWSQEEPRMERIMDEHSLGEVNPIIIEIEGEEKSARNIEEKETAFEVTSIAVEILQSPGVPENEELVQETRGVIERIRDEGKTDETVDEKPVALHNARTQKGVRKGENMAENKEIGHIENVSGVSVDGKKEAGQENLHAPEGEPEPTSTVTSSKDVDTASKEVYGEEEMWEKMEGMRRIVGYKGARSSSCVEELKALYLFTGVEPPACFKDHSDLVEVSDKLQFLMSIVGIK